VIRHSAAVYRLISDHFGLDIGEAAGALLETEEYPKYSFDLAAALGEAVREGWVFLAAYKITYYRSPG